MTHICAESRSIVKAVCLALLIGLIVVELTLARAAPGMAATEMLPAEAAYSFINGQWFDGQRFIKGTWYSVRGKLTRKEPAGPIEIVDLAGAYVVPPFGEAHNHNVEGEWDVRAVIDRYLRDGVFYVKNPERRPRFRVEDQRQDKSFS